MKTLPSGEKIMVDSLQRLSWRKTSLTFSVVAFSSNPLRDGSTTVSVNNNNISQIKLRLAIMILTVSGKLSQGEQVIIIIMIDHASPRYMCHRKSHKKCIAVAKLAMVVVKSNYYYGTESR